MLPPGNPSRWLLQNSDATEFHFQPREHGMECWSMPCQEAKIGWQSGFAPILPLSCTEFRIVSKFKCLQDGQRGNHCDNASCSGLCDADGPGPPFSGPPLAIMPLAFGLDSISYDFLDHLQLCPSVRNFIIRNLHCETMWNRMKRYEQIWKAATTQMQAAREPRKSLQGILLCSLGAMPLWDARGPWGVYLGTGRVGRMGEGSAPHPPGDIAGAQCE